MPWEQSLLNRERISTPLPFPVRVIGEWVSGLDQDGPERAVRFQDELRRDLHMMATGVAHEGQWSLPVTELTSVKLILHLAARASNVNGRLI